MISEAVNHALRQAILAAASSPLLQRFVRRHGLRLGASRFVGGESLEEIVPVLRRLNDRGLRANTTLLGESVRDRGQTERIAAAYQDILERIGAEGLDANVAVKLTQLGLDVDEELAYANLLRIVERAAELENFVRIDMESSGYVDATLRIYRRLRETGHENVGTVLQSYLYRSEGDLRALLPLRPNLRIVKGAYLEPPEVAYPHKRDVDAAYVRLVELCMSEAAFTAVATHDERLIEHAIAFAERKGIERVRFEFQMLYGVRPRLQLELMQRGFRVLVATPFGPDWYPYLMRRLAERPANVLFFVRSAIRR
jgi:proline dehydrogenase